MRQPKPIEDTILCSLDRRGETNKDFYRKSVGVPVINAESLNKKKNRDYQFGVILF